MGKCIGGTFSDARVKDQELFNRENCSCVLTGVFSRKGNRVTKSNTHEVAEPT